MEDLKQQLIAQRNEALSRYYAGKTMAEKADNDVQRLSVQLQTLQRVESESSGAE